MVLWLGLGLVLVLIVVMGRYTENTELIFDILKTDNNVGIWNTEYSVM